MDLLHAVIVIPLDVGDLQNDGWRFPLAELWPYLSEVYKKDHQAHILDPATPPGMGAFLLKRAQDSLPQREIDNDDTN